MNEIVSNKERYIEWRMKVFDKIKGSVTDSDFDNEKEEIKN